MSGLPETHIAFLVDQAVAAFVGGCLVIAFGLQIATEPDSPGDVKYWFHRLGLMGTIFLMLYHVDPYEFHQAYPLDRISAFFFRYALVLAFWCSIIVAYYAMIGVLSGTRRSVPVRTFRFISLFLGAFVLAAATTVSVLETTSCCPQRGLTEGIWDFFLAATVVVLVVGVFISVQKAVRVLTVSQGRRFTSDDVMSPRTESEFLKRVVKRLKRLQMVTGTIGGLFFAAQVYTGVTNLLNPDGPRTTSDRDPNVLDDFLIHWMLWIVYIMILWYSWIEDPCSRCCNRNRDTATVQPLPTPEVPTNNPPPHLAPTPENSSINSTHEPLLADPKSRNQADQVVMPTPISLIKVNR